ncbi:MAG TPA: hypothetical protein VK395_35600 [Gemmataceae bacterium]|nr:hypothetical protein [Gemmataceae bacterium]
MEGSTECLDALISSGPRRLSGHQRLLFMAEVATELREALRLSQAPSPEPHAEPGCGELPWQVRVLYPN